MFLYILSQLLGSTLALQYMRAEFVAPLGSTNLIFNFIVANYMLGIPITKKDVQGTLLIVVGVIGIVSFGSIAKTNDELDITLLKSLWGRSAWLFWFLFLLLTTFSVYLLAADLEKASKLRNQHDYDNSDENSQANQNVSKLKLIYIKFIYYISFIRTKLYLSIEKLIMNLNDASLKKLIGLIWAIEGGIMASECLILAKAT